MLSFIGKILERRRMEREGHLGTRKRRTESVLSAAADRSLALTMLLVGLLWIICVLVLTLPAHRNFPTLVVSQIAPSTIFARTDFIFEDKAETARQRAEREQRQAVFFKFSPTGTEQMRQRIKALQKAVSDRFECEKRSAIYHADANDQLAVQIAALGPAAFKVFAPLKKDHLFFSNMRTYLDKLIDGGIVSKKKYGQLAPDTPVFIYDSSGRQYRSPVFGSMISCDVVTEKLTSWLISDLPSSEISELDKQSIAQLMSVLVGSDGNLELDEEYTNKQKEFALQGLQPVMLEIKKNQPIVKRNATVTDKVIDALQAERATYESMQKEQTFLESLMHNASWTLIMLLFAGFYLKHIHPEIIRSSRRIAMIVTISAVSLLINYLTVEGFYFASSTWGIPPELLPDALPLALPAVLLTVMAGYRVALYVGFFAAMVSALMLNGSFTVALEGFVLSALCGLVVRPSGNYRSFFLRSFFCVAVTVMLLDFNWFWHITSAPKVLLYLAAVAIGNALLTAVSAMLLTFLFELLFNVSTNMSLMVLCDYNHPLLKELHLRAPGTSLHSQNVAVLAENAAMEIDANAVLARAGALFHDIGKIKNPEYFIENNQSGSNPHNKLNPRMSSLIISNHVKDGMDLALQHKLCRKVRQFIQQHHGTDLIKYFYHMALNNDENVLESDYRYPGPLPHEKEVIIVSLADACEAACRSLEKPTAGKIESMVNDIFIKRWRDGQLDDADLTIEELSIINESFVHTLTTMYHSRIAYPKDENSNEDDVLVQERPAAGSEPKAPASGNE